MSGGDEADDPAKDPPIPRITNEYASKMSLAQSFEAWRRCASSTCSGTDLERPLCRRMMGMLIRRTRRAIRRRDDVGTGGVFLRSCPTCTERECDERANQ